jgi:hypothetical protein
MLIVTPPVGSGGGGVISGITINPLMTTNTEPAPHIVVPLHQLNASYAGYKAFNHNNQDLGWAGRPVDGELWIAYGHGSPVVVNQTRITSLTQSKWACYSYQVYGTNDSFTDVAGVQAATWTLLDTVSCPSLAPSVWSQYYAFTNTTAYSGYKFQITSWGTDGAQLQELELIAA